MDGRFGSVELARARRLLAKAEALAARHAKPPEDPSLTENQARCGAAGGTRAAKRPEDPPLTENQARVLPHAQEYVDAGLQYNHRAISKKTGLAPLQVKRIIPRLVEMGRLPDRGRKLPKTAGGLRPLDYAHPLFTQNKGLIHKPLRAQLAATPGVDAETLRDAAEDALARAARGFDPARGLAFSTLAVTAITNSLQKAVDRELRNAHKSIDAATDGVSLHDALPASVDTAKVALAKVEAEEAAARLFEVSHGINEKHGERYALAYLLHHGHDLQLEEIAKALGFNNHQRVQQVVAVIEKRLAKQGVSATSIPPAPRASRLPSRESSRKG